MTDMEIQRFFGVHTPDDGKSLYKSWTSGAMLVGVIEGITEQIHPLR